MLLPKACGQVGFFGLLVCWFVFCVSALRAQSNLSAKCRTRHDGSEPAMEFKLCTVLPPKDTRTQQRQPTASWQLPDDGQRKWRNSETTSGGQW